MPVQTHPKSNQNRTLIAYLALTYGMTWAFWIPAALTGLNVMTFPVILLHTLGGFAPSLAGIWMVYRVKDRTGRRDFWRRVVDIKRIGFPNLLAILVLFPALTFGSVLIAKLLGLTPSSFESLRLLSSQPLLLIPWVLMGFITGPISEELGWRGFALEALQSRWKPAAASLFLGFAWWGWHLPLFFIEGTSQSAMGFGTAPFWLFSLNIFPLTAWMTWFYNRTGGSILSGVLMHFAYNFNATLFFPLSLGGSVLFAVLLAISGGIVLWDLRRLERGASTGQLETA